MAYFIELEQIFQKINMKPKKTTNTFRNLKKNEDGSFTIHNIKLYYKVIVIKPAWYWHKNTHIYHWNRTEAQKSTHTFMVN